jgi:small-conductance mechanosensitive channel
MHPVAGRNTFSWVTRALFCSLLMVLPSSVWWEVSSLFILLTLSSNVTIGDLFVKLVTCKLLVQPSWQNKNNIILGLLRKGWISEGSVTRDDDESIRHSHVHWLGTMGIIIHWNNEAKELSAQQAALNDDSPCRHSRVNSWWWIAMCPSDDN